MASATLERRCRLLLLAYPHGYRAERGEEILTTLLDATPVGRHWPVPADAVDVVAGGVRQRLGTQAQPGLDGGLALAAPVALALAAGIAGFAWWRVEPVAPNVHLGSDSLFGVFRTLGPIAYAAWVLAGIGYAVLRPAVTRALVAGAIAVTVSLPMLAPLTRIDRPPLWVVFALAAFGLLALAPAPPPSSLDARLAVPAGAVAVAAATSTVVSLWTPPNAASDYYYQPTIARVGAVVTAAVVCVAAVAVIRQLRGRGSAEWLWATAVLGLPAGWMGPFDSGGLRDAVPHFGRLAQVVLASCVAVATIAWIARVRWSGSLHRPAGIAIGAALGLTAFLLAFVPPAAIAPYVWVGIGALAVTGIAALAGARSAEPRTVAVSALTALVLAWLVGVYDNGWTISGWHDLGQTASLVITLALVPLSLSVHAAVRAVRRGRDRRTRIAAAVVLVTGLGWLGYAAVPYVLSWGPVPFVLAICCVAVALSRRPAPSAPSSP